MRKKIKRQSDPFDPFGSAALFGFDDLAASTSSEADETGFDSLEAESKSEVTEYQQAIRDAATNTRKSLQDQWNTDFYFCAFFADQAQRDEFLEKAGALGLVKDNFINGQKLAELLGVAITPRTIERPKLFAPKRDWFDITL